MPTEIPSNPLTIPAGTLQRGNRRVRPYAGGQLVADSAAPLLVWEHSYYPRYAFSPAEVEVELVAEEHPHAHDDKQQTEYRGTRATAALARFGRRSVC